MVLDRIKGHTKYLTFGQWRRVRDTRTEGCRGMCAGRNTLSLPANRRTSERVVAWLLVIVYYDGPYAFLAI